MPRSVARCWFNCITALAVVAFCLLTTHDDARAQTTTWTGTVGDWGTGSNWSNGEPTASIDAVIPAAATAAVTLPGETCRNLTTATIGANTLRIENGGSLTVIETFHLGSGAVGSVLHSGGSLSAADLIVANVGIPAAYTMTGGTAMFGNVQIGNSQDISGGSFTMSVLSPSVTVTGSLNIPDSGNFSCGGGTLTVGTEPTDGIVLDGTFSLNNSPTVTTTGFTMSSDGTLSIFLGPLGVARINVDGTATLAGQILVTDIGAAEGTYEILRAASVQGSFDTAFLPPNLSWRVEGNSVLITKSDVPIEPTTWSGVKKRFTR